MHSHVNSLRGQLLICWRTFVVIKSRARPRGKYTDYWEFFVSRCQLPQRSTNSWGLKVTSGTFTMKRSITSCVILQWKAGVSSHRWMRSTRIMCYTLCLTQLCHTQLYATISFLHEPAQGYIHWHLTSLKYSNRFWLIAPFGVLNKKEIQSSDFSTKLNRCTPKESGKNIFVKAWEGKVERDHSAPSAEERYCVQIRIRLLIAPVQNQNLTAKEVSREFFPVWPRER